LFGRALASVALLLSLLPRTASALPQSHETAGTEAIDVVLRSPVQLTAIERRELRAKIREYGSHSAGEIVRELYQDKGYFKVEVIPIQTPTSNAKALVLQVNTGKQYHLKVFHGTGMLRYLNPSWPVSFRLNLANSSPGRKWQRA